MGLYIDPLPPEEPKKEWHRGCLHFGISSLIILSLLATSIASLYWFASRNNERMESTSLPAVANVENEPDTVNPTRPVEEDSESAEVEGLEKSSDYSINRIVFVNGERQIETVAPDGSERRLLTDESKFYEFPAWSPDGRQIATLGGNRTGGGIYLLQDNADPDDPQEIYFSQEQRPFYLYWSPDNKQISFLANNPDHGMGLNVIDARMGMDSRLIASGTPFYWSWTTDSQQMLIHSGSLEKDARLVLIDDAGQDQAPQIPDPGFFQAPGISPTGRYWAYSQLKEGSISWVTVDDQISGEQHAERHVGSVALNWSPVADKLAFISGEDNGQFNFWGPLRILDMTTGATRLLSSNLVLAFFWSPDGKQIFTVSVPDSSGLNGGVEVREAKNRHLARHANTELSFQTMPHQFMLSVIDVESGTGLEMADVTLPTIFLSQFLVFFDQYALSHNLWSPNSEQIVLPIVEDGENKIMVFTTSSGRRHQVGNGFMAFWSKQ